MHLYTCKICRLYADMCRMRYADLCHVYAKIYAINMQYICTNMQYTKYSYAFSLCKYMQIYAIYAQPPARAQGATYMQVYAFICTICKWYMHDAIYADGSSTSFCRDSDNKLEKRLAVGDSALPRLCRFRLGVWWPFESECSESESARREHNKVATLNKF